MSLFITYLLFGITLAISIGPVNVELIKRGLTRGFLPSWFVGIGGMAADFLILFIIYLGLGTYLRSDIAQLLLGFIGSLLLIQIGIQNAGKGLTSTIEPINISEKTKDKKSFQTGFLLAIANPLNIVFWAGIYSSLLSINEAAHTTPYLLISSIFLGIAISNIVFALISSLAKSYVKPTTLRLISSTSGIVLVGYGLWMGYTTISSKIGIVLGA